MFPQASANQSPALSDYDINLTLKDVPFEDTEIILRDFIEKYPVKTYPNQEKRQNGEHKIFVDGHWGQGPIHEERYLERDSYAVFILDNSSQQLYLRVRNPTTQIWLDDCIVHRDNFGDKFIDYLIENNYDVQ